ncbi:uncharacterized protein LOC115404206 isoform X2 [Salarias fasciatus]|uniref:Uncharacterized LOC115404206 n=1 Tax=Salarias fasciatus TaxID=181472 RepID=A0A672J0E0_SALFA|nr:uncharacterized protein LOC115404206 isoform X2 [Salarias fasciatus]
MGNLSRGSDAATSDQASREKCVTRRISSSVTYYYSPLSEAGCPPKPPGTLSSSLSPPAPPVADSMSQSHSASASRPLLVFFSWFGATPGPVAKYRDLYLDRGMDVLLVQSSMMHFLWPRWGLDYGLKVLNILEEPQFSKRPVLVHASSLGGYTFTQMLAHVAHGEEKRRGLARRVMGHVYDSLVVGSLEYMAIGLGKTLLPRFQGLIKRIAMLYFWLFKEQTADFYERSVRVFHYSPITAPALFFYSEDDALCHTEVIESVMDLWRRRGVAVHSRKWKESIHAAHLRCHPQDYLSTLQHFLNSLPLSSQEAEI